MLNSIEHEISTAHKKLKYRQINLSDVGFIILIRVEMPTIIGILTFKSTQLRPDEYLKWV